MIQGSDEWKTAKLGTVSASNVGKILKGSKGYYLASRKNYMAKLVCERLTRTWEDSFTSAAMQRGIDLECIARSTYEAKTGVMVIEDGFKLHDNIVNFGCSPDGLVNSNGGIEIKCPETATHIETLTGTPIKRDYIIQMQCGMMVYNRQWWDFISFDDRLPIELSYYCHRVQRDEKLIGEITEEINKFNSELFEMLTKLKELNNGK